MTDGMENSSHEWTWDAVRQLTKQQQDEWGWTFIFLGANIDAIEVGGRMGFDATTSLTYDDSDYANTAGAMRVAREMVSTTRAGGSAAFSDEDRDVAMGRSTI